MSEFTLERPTTRQTESHQLTNWTPRQDSPLDHVDVVTIEGIETETTVAIQELKGLSHLILRGNSHVPSFCKAVKQALGVELPVMSCTSMQNNELRIFWQSPNEWLIIGPPNSAEKIEQSLRNCLQGHFAVTDISSSQTLVTIKGENAENVLRKSTSYDVDIRNFPIGKVAGIAFSRSQVQLRRTDKTSFELIIRRSFADYIWMWLMDASNEYGVIFIKD
ncbi:sarcosine oxidase subunit gamma [Vibrio sp. nBUS_14]|uniref:sarcosine oxidase subunit gamma n=1 Tax=Vibrio sp. nBUS_14 TaxID=3395321 RepID=UPI003EBEF264